MKIRFMKGIIVMALAFSAAGAVQAADDFPRKPVRIIVPVPPGGLIDSITRLVGGRMAEKLGQTVIVENRDGAGSLVGTRFVKSQPADGYTLLSTTTNAMTASVAIDSNAGYDTLKDFTGVGPMIRAPWLMVVGNNQRIKTVAEFIARAKARPEEVSFSSGGEGGGSHLAASAFLHRAGLNVLHVPYKGNGPARADVIANRVTMTFAAGGAADARSGVLTPLGFTSAARLAAFPDIPTIAEQGLPNYSDYVWFAMFAPARTPKDAIQRLSDTMQRSTREFRERIEKDGNELIPMSPDEFNEFVKREMVEMAKLIANMGLKKRD